AYDRASLGMHKLCSISISHETIKNPVYEEGTGVIKQKGQKRQRVWEQGEEIPSGVRILTSEEYPAEPSIGNGNEDRNEDINENRLRKVRWIREFYDDNTLLIDDKDIQSIRKYFKDKVLSFNRLYPLLLFQRYEALYWYPNSIP
ncbi:MAG: hypothetical protein ACPL1G_08225, partial [Thermodesulfovibrionales bacterium]